MGARGGAGFEERGEDGCVEERGYAEYARWVLFPEALEAGPDVSHEGVNAVWVLLAEGLPDGGVVES